MQYSKSCGILFKSKHITPPLYCPDLLIVLVLIFIYLAQHLIGESQKKYFNKAVRAFY